MVSRIQSAMLRAAWADMLMRLPPACRVPYPMQVSRPCRYTWMATLATQGRCAARVHAKVMQRSRCVCSRSICCRTSQPPLKPVHACGSCTTGVPVRVLSELRARTSGPQSESEARGTGITRPAMQSTCTKGDNAERCELGKRLARSTARSSPQHRTKRSPRAPMSTAFL